MHTHELLLPGRTLQAGDLYEEPDNNTYAPISPDLYGVAVGDFRPHIGAKGYPIFQNKAGRFLRPRGDVPTLTNAPTAGTTKAWYGVLAWAALAVWSKARG